MKPSRHAKSHETGSANLAGQLNAAIATTQKTMGINAMRARYHIFTSQ